MKKTLNVLTSLLLALGLTSHLTAASFTAGNIVVYRAGSGTGNEINTGNPVFLDEYSTSGTLVQSIPMPTTVSGANKPLVCSGTATSEGLMTRSADGRYLLVPGYGSTIPAASSLTSSSSSTVNRIIGRVDATGAVDTSVALTDWSTGNNPRGVASTDGTVFWVGGGAGGVRYVNSPSATTSVQINTGTGTLANTRHLSIFNGQLYYSDSSTAGGNNIALGAIGTGTPTTAGQNSSGILNIATTAPISASAYAYFFADLSGSVPGVDTLYIADDNSTSGGILKFSLVSGSWVPNGSVGAAADAYRGLTATVSGTTVTLYATRKGGSGTTGGGEIVKIVDTTGYNTAIGSPTITLLATAAANTAFRGVALAPVSYTVTYNGNGNTSGSAPTDNTAYADGATVTVASNSGSLARTGYTFNGWNTQADGNGTSYAAGSGTFTINANTTLYAKWAPSGVTYTLTYTAGPNGSISGTTPQTVNSGDNGTPVLAVPNSGYQFISWSDASTANPRTDNNVVANISVTASFAAPPSVTTPTSTGITSLSATLGGNVTDDGGSTVTERGVVYSLTSQNANPLLNGTGVTKVSASGTTGVFTAGITGLARSTNYSFKAYAVNAVGTNYTPVASFNTFAGVTFLGVAAGDVSSTNAIVWTRATDDTQPGAAINLTLQYSTDNTFVSGVSNVAVGTASATTADNTAKQAVTNLLSGTRYYYRFLGANGETSITGTFKTAPDAGSAAAVKFGFSGDMDGLMRPYALASQVSGESLDFYLNCGDVIYENASNVKGNIGLSYTNSPSVTLSGSAANLNGVPNGTNAATHQQLFDDYNKKYREQFLPVNLGGQSCLQSFYAGQGNYTLSDNHELGNRQYINGGAPAGDSVGGPNSSDMATGRGVDARGTSLTDNTNDAADVISPLGGFMNTAQGFTTLQQVFLNYQPVKEDRATATVSGDPRTGTTKQLFFAQPWGKNAVYIHTDSRTYRDIRLKTATGSADDAGPRADNTNRTYLGKTQLAWLEQQLLAAETNGTPWKFVAMSDPIDQIGPISQTSGTAALSTLTGVNSDGGKSYIGGYRAERNALLKFIADNHIRNVVFLATDDHQNRINEVTYAPNGITGPGAVGAGTQAQIQAGYVKVPYCFSIVCGPLGATGPDAIVNHDYTNILAIANDLAAKQSAAGIEPIGLVGYPGLHDVMRDTNGVLVSETSVQPVDFYSPDTFNYNVLEVSADGRTLTVTSRGINSTAQNAALEYGTGGTNLVRTLFSFKVDAATVPLVKVGANIYQPYDTSLTNNSWVYVDADPAAGSPVRATQRSLGYREVDYKSQVPPTLYFASVTPTTNGNFLTYDYSAQANATNLVGFWSAKDVPIVIGTDGLAYITDGHHTTAGYLAASNLVRQIVPNLNRVILGHIVANYYNVTNGPVAVNDSWWTARAAENNAFLYGTNGDLLTLSGEPNYAALQPILPGVLPMPTTPSKLTTNAMLSSKYRSLTWGLADAIVDAAKTAGGSKIAGYKKSALGQSVDLNFVEFYWADFLRNRVVWDDSLSGSAFGSGNGDSSVIAAPLSFFTAVANGIALARSEVYRDEYGRLITAYTNSALFPPTTTNWAVGSISRGFAAATDTYNLFFRNDSYIAGDITPSALSTNVLHIDAASPLTVTNLFQNFKTVIVNGGFTMKTAWKDATVTNSTLTLPAGTATVIFNGTLSGGALVVSNGTFGGNGVINGSVTIKPGATLAPGSSIGKLTVTGPVTLGGIAALEISKSGSVLTNDSVSGITTLTEGGTLNVVASGDSLAGGDSFQLFNAANYTGSFSSVNLPALDSGLAWDTHNLAVNGTITVVSTSAVTLNPILGGANLTINWPADHLGWRLEIQTNSLGSGLGNNWVTWPGSADANSAVIPVSPLNPSVFLRLVFP